MGPTTVIPKALALTPCFSKTIGTRAPPSNKNATLITSSSHPVRFHAIATTKAGTKLRWIMKQNFFNALSILLSLILLQQVQAHAQIPEGITVVRPKESHEILYNPGIGFTTFQRFNGDTDNVLEHCCGDFKDGFP